MANALSKMGVGIGDRVCTIAWNGFRHFELYYGVSGKGAVLHTVNPRLHPDQISYVINHAENKLLFVDLTFYPAVEKLLPTMKTIRGVVVMTDRANMPPTAGANVICYEELIAGPSLSSRTAHSPRRHPAEPPPASSILLLAPPNHHLLPHTSQLAASVP